MKKSSASLRVGFLAAAMALSACGGEDKPKTRGSSLAGLDSLLTEEEKRAVFAGANPSAHDHADAEREARMQRQVERFQKSRGMMVQYEVETAIENGTEPNQAQSESGLEFYYPIYGGSDFIEVDADLLTRSGGLTSAFLKRLNACTDGFDVNPNDSETEKIRKYKEHLYGHSITDETLNAILQECYTRHPEKFPDRAP